MSHQTRASRWLFAGFDASTQGLTTQVIECGGGEPARVVYEHVINYERDLPQYGTRHGVLPSEDPRVAVAPPQMWADALEMAMARIASSGMDLSRLRAISGCAQQHGTVYLDAQGGFTRATSPIWLDATTTVECDEITRALGGDDAIARLTGSRAFERFAGPQIRRFAKTQPEAYARTARIHLISSFLASLLVSSSIPGPKGPGLHPASAPGSEGPGLHDAAFNPGPEGPGLHGSGGPGLDDATGARDLQVPGDVLQVPGDVRLVDAPIDPGDGSGMSLMSLTTRDWDAAALEATAPNLRAKLPPIASSDLVAGPLGARWRERYGFPAVDVVVWTGDNSSSMIGSGVVEEGMLAISLGTSDTIFGPMRVPRVSANGEGHVFGSPAGDWMGITVFANGSLARERVRDQYGMTWKEFSAALRSTPPGNGGALMLPWFGPEITPRVIHAGVHRLNLDEREAARNVRAIVEGQMLAMATHARWMGVDVSTIYATGGASGNRDVLQVMADVFNARVFPSPVRASGSLGAALRAWHAYDHAHGGAISWPDVVRDLATPDPATAIEPGPSATTVYPQMQRDYAAFESRHFS